MITKTPRWRRKPLPFAAANRVPVTPGARRGTTLIELIGYLGILAVAMLLLSEVFMMLMHVTKETTDRDVMIGRVDTAVDMLRRDVWSATEIKITPPASRGPESAGGAASAGTSENRVEMKEPGGTIVWQMGDDGLLTRSDGGTGPGHTWTWKDMPKVTFAVQGSVLVVQVDSGPGGGKHEQVTLISQRLAGGRL